MLGNLNSKLNMVYYPQTIDLSLTFDQFDQRISQLKTLLLHILLSRHT